MDHEDSCSTSNNVSKRPRLSSQNSRDGHMNGYGSSESDDTDVFGNTIRMGPSDAQLLRWQERQIAKCIVDNTVNRVVESYLTYFDENNEELPERSRDYDEIYINEVEVQPTRHLTEESAIRRAIERHGMLGRHVDLDSFLTTESTSSSSSSSSSAPSSPKSPECSPPSPAMSQTPNNTSSQENEVLESWRSQSESQSTISNDNQRSASESDENQMNQESISMETNEEPALEEQKEIEETNTQNPANQSDHMDFMEAAVSVAIQNKGLSIQMSPNR